MQGDLDRQSLIVEMQEAEADIMAILTTAGPVLLEELRAGSAYMQAKSEATAHFKSGERALALDAYEACLQILKSNPLPHEAHTTTDGDAALKLKALGAEMAKVNSNCSMLYLDIGQLEAAIVAGAAAISNCPSWPKAHGRHGKALEAAGQHDRAAQAYAMAALRAGQQKQPADEAMWVRCASTERQRPLCGPWRATPTFAAPPIASSRQPRPARVAAARATRNHTTTTHISLAAANVE